MPKHEGLGAAIAVLLAFSGLIVLVGVILLMMLMQPGIKHSPTAHNRTIGTSAAVGRLRIGGRL